MFVNTCLNLCRCNKTFHKNLIISQKLLIWFLQPSLILFTLPSRLNQCQFIIKSVNSGVDIGHIESAFIQVQVFHCNPVMYFDSNEIYKCD